MSIWPRDLAPVYTTTYPQNLLSSGIIKVRLFISVLGSVLGILAGGSF